MPNHIANEITGPDLDRIRGWLRGPEKAVDFNELIPMPEGLSIEPHMGIIDAAKVACKDWPDASDEGWNGIIARLEIGNMQRQKSPLEFSEEEWALYIQCIQNRRAHGFYTWFEWSREHWGTKWNAYSIKDRGDSLYFETAWSCPEPIVRKLAEVSSGNFVWQYADEDHGRNLGIWRCKDGALDLQQPAVEDLEEWAMRLHGWDDAQIAEYRAEVATESAC